MRSATIAREPQSQSAVRGAETHQILSNGPAAEKSRGLIEKSNGISEPSRCLSSPVRITVD